MRRRSPEAEPDGLDLLEEAAHLLRGVPLAAHAAYLAGTVPFLLGLLYWVADMSRAADASGRSTGAAFGMVVLFAWMKAAQAVAAERALAFLEQREPARLGPLRLVALAFAQLRLQAGGLFLLPVAAVVAMPFGWVYAYYQNATVLGISAGPRAHHASLELAGLWPRQNHLSLVIVTAVSLFVFVNVGVAIYFVPSVLRSLLGLEGVMPTVGWNPFNTTFLAAAVALTHLVVDPWLKALFVVRCFHGQSRRTGLDLLVQTRRAAARLGGLAAALIVMAAFAIGAAPRATAAEAVATGVGVEAGEAPAAVLPDPAVEPAALDDAVDAVLRRPEFSWRLERDEARDEEEEGLVGRFLRSVFGSIADGARWLGRQIGRLADWLFRRSLEPEKETPAGLGGLVGALRVALPVLIFGLLVALALMAWRWWQRSRGPAPATASAGVLPVVDEDATADLLPGEEWLRLAREHLARGETRLAVRAYFLATLAALAARGLVLLARHKSNRDYERELARRGGTVEAATAAFRENRRVVERVWYGRDSVGADELGSFEANVRRLMEAGE